MSKTFNLLLLHQNSDIHPRSWICLKGPKIKQIVEGLEEQIIRKEKICREDLSKKIAKKLNCSFWVIKTLLQGKKDFYPIIFLIKLFEIAGKRNRIEINNHTEFLKVNSASSKPIKAVKEVNETLGKILGAFMADGSLSISVVFSSKNKEGLTKIKESLIQNNCDFSESYSASRKEHFVDIRLNKKNLKIVNSLLTQRPCFSQTHYSIELSEEYEDSVKAFNKWIFDEFGIYPTYLRKRENMFNTVFSSKILGRYLTTFFDASPGYKAKTAFEPTIIKNSNFPIRKAFALGVLTFDGCITKQGKMTLNSKSKILVESIKEIWEKDGIYSGKVQYRNKRDDYVIGSHVQSKKEKIASYFEKKTQKWKLVHWIDGDQSKQPIIKKTAISKSSIEEVLKSINNVKSCDVKFLCNYFNYKNQTSLTTYLNILKKHNKVRFSNVPRKINLRAIDKNTGVLLKNDLHDQIFNGIRQKFKVDKELCKFLNIDNRAYSNWRLRKNRIPINILEKILPLINFDSTSLINNIQETDRKIIEIIE